MVLLLRLSFSVFFVLTPAFKSAEEKEVMRENLRPRNMAETSPKTFWNLVQLFGGDTTVGLQRLLPNQDWSWLNTRRRNMSNKVLILSLYSFLIPRSPTGLFGVRFLSFIPHRAFLRPG